MLLAFGEQINILLGNQQLAFEQVTDGNDDIMLLSLLDNGNQLHKEEAKRVKLDGLSEQFPEQSLDC